MPPMRPAPRMGWGHAAGRRGPERSVGGSESRPAPCVRGPLLEGAAQVVAALHRVPRGLEPPARFGEIPVVELPGASERVSIQPEPAEEPFEVLSFGGIRSEFDALRDGAERLD